MLGATVALVGGQLREWCWSAEITEDAEIAAFETELVLKQSPLLRTLSDTNSRYMAWLDRSLPPSTAKDCVIGMLCKGMVRLHDDAERFPVEVCGFARLLIKVCDAWLVIRLLYKCRRR